MANFKAWVEKSPRNGSFFVRFRDGKTKLPNGRWKVFTKRTIDKDQRLQVDGKWKTAKVIAEDLAKKLEANDLNDLLGNCDLAQPLEPLVEKYIKDRESSGLNWSTTEHYEIVLRKILKECRLTTLADFSDEAIRAWKEKAFGALQNSTLAGELIIVFVFTRWLIDHEHLKNWPFKKGMIPSVKRPGPKFYTRDEWEALDKILASRDPMARLACNLAYYAGLRKIELVGDSRGRLGVLWEDLVWLPNGGVEVVIRKEVGKGGMRSRTIRLDPHIVALLGSRKSGPIIELTRNRFQYLFYESRKKAHINRKLTIHGLRHSFSKNYLQYGRMDLSALKQMLGHSDIKTTQIYSAHEPTHLADGINRAFQNRKSESALLKHAGHLQGKTVEIEELPEPSGTLEALHSSNENI